MHLLVPSLHLFRMLQYSPLFSSNTFLHILYYSKYFSDSCVCVVACNKLYRWIPYFLISIHTHLRGPMTDGGPLPSPAPSLLWVLPPSPRGCQITKFHTPPTNVMDGELRLSVQFRGYLHFENGITGHVSVERRW